MRQFRGMHAFWIAALIVVPAAFAAEEQAPQAGETPPDAAAAAVARQRPANFEMPPEQVAEFKDLVANVEGEPAREDFAKLEEHFAAARAAPAPGANGISWLEWYYAHFAAPEKEDLESFKRFWERLDRWIAAFPESPTPLVCKAYSHIHYGWSERGSGYANTVSEARWAVFHDQLESALKLLERARELKGHDAEVYGRLIVVGMAGGAPRRVIDEYLAGARKIDPAYFPAYQNVAVELLPRWGGAPGDIGEFAEQMLRENPGDLGLEIYARIAAEVNRYDKMLLLDGEFDLVKVRAGARILQARYPKSVSLMNFAGLVGWRAQDLELAKGSEEMVGSNSESRVWGGDPEHIEQFARFCKMTVPPPKRQRIVWVLPGLSLFTAFSPSGKSLVVGMQSQAAAVNVLSLEDLSVTTEVGERHLCEGIAVDRAGKRMAAAYMRDFDGTPASAELYQVGDWQNPLVLEDPRVDKYSSPCFSPDGRLVAIAHNVGQIGLWNVESGKLERILKTFGIIARPLFSPEGTRVVANYHDRAEIFEVATGKSLHRLPLAPAADGARIETILAFRNDGKLLAAGRNKDGGKYYVFLWDPAAKKRWNLLADLPGPPIAVSPKRTLVAIGEYHTTAPRQRGWSSIHLWSLADSRHLAEYGVSETAQSLCFSPDETTIAFACQDRSVHIWDISELLPENR